MGDVMPMARRVEYARAVLRGTAAGALFRQYELAAEAAAYQCSALGALAGCRPPCVSCNTNPCVHPNYGLHDMRSLELAARKHLRSLKLYDTYIVKRRAVRRKKRSGVTARSISTSQEWSLFNNAISYCEESLAWR